MRPFVVGASVLLLGCAPKREVVTLQPPAEVSLQQELLAAEDVAVYRLDYLNVALCGPASEVAAAIPTGLLSMHALGWGRPPERVSATWPRMPGFEDLEVAGQTEAMPPGFVRTPVWIVAAARKAKGMCREPLAPYAADGVPISAEGGRHPFLWEVYDTREAAIARLEALKGLRGR